MDHAQLLAMLPKLAKRLLDVVEGAVISNGGISAPLSYDDLNSLGLDRRGLPQARLMLVKLGLVEVTFGARGVSQYSLAPGWRSLSSPDAQRLVTLAKQPQAPRPRSKRPKPQQARAVPKPVTVKRRRARAAPSLPVLSFLNRDA